MEHVRAHIRLNTTADANDFVTAMNSTGSVDKFIIEDYNRIQRANARSLLGVIYALSDYNDEMYLVNETNDGDFPSFVDKYRINA